MILVRTGSRFLFLRTNDADRLKDFLINHLDGKMESLDQVLKESRERDTIVFITPGGLEKTYTDDAKHIVLVPTGSTIVLTNILNKGGAALVDRADLGPGLLLVRTPDNDNKIINKIKEEYKAKPVDFLEGLNIGETNDTIVGFCPNPISHAVNIKELISPSLLISRPLPSVYQDLRRQTIRFITGGLEKASWYEVLINIGDTDGLFEVHYKRLVLALEEFDVGLILGEAWTRDVARILFSVDAYQVKLFTPFHPQNLKQILLGLEYKDDGKRICDMDLYHRRQKVEWAEVVDGNLMGRIGAGVYFRKQMLQQMSEETKQKFLALESNLY
ncbi:MAG TPA: hypothetical protein VFD15_06950 [Clostridia bacterium]|nr:hypothetical protein [Clostridia bacterium]